MNLCWILVLAFSGWTWAQDVADPETTTPYGCTCTSLCGATIEDQFDRDWCYTADDCGEYSIVFGHWDWCLYQASEKPGYDTDWQTKQEVLWQQIKDDSSIGGYHPTDVFTESVKTTFENEWDVLPAGRTKVIHGIGAICPFKVDIPANSPFSGLFKPGTTNGLIRLGPATDMMDGNGMVPGASVKFLRTGTASANFVLLHTLTPLPNMNHNFFAEALSNHLPEPADPDIPTTILAQKFCTTGHCITKVGLSNVCTHDQDGNKAAELKFPFKVTFEPADVSFGEDKPNSNQEFMDQFRVLPIGTKLYNIKAHQNPDDVAGLDLGAAITTDECVTSLYGDTRLFFKHQWIEDDVALMPAWTEGYADQCYCNAP